jgi:hypothetical protein
MNITNLLPAKYLEHEFFNKMFQFLDPEIMKDKKIFVSHDYNTPPATGRNVIVILTAGDEKGKPPLYANQVGWVFKHHLDHDRVDNVYHLALPYPNKFSGNAKTPIEKRDIDVFFAGCRRGSRAKFLKELKYYMQKSRHEVKFQVKITGKFGSGYSIKAYSDIISNSKIVLSPRGWVRPECLRFSEAVRCGCAVIAEPHPEVSCFEDTPFYAIPTWTAANLARAVDHCLKNQKKIHEGMKQSWERYFSPQAQAAIINRVVGG